MADFAGLVPDVYANITASVAAHIIDGNTGGTTVTDNSTYTENPSLPTQVQVASTHANPCYIRATGGATLAGYFTSPNAAVDFINYLDWNIDDTSDHSFLSQDSKSVYISGCTAIGVFKGYISSGAVTIYNSSFDGGANAYALESYTGFESFRIINSTLKGGTTSVCSLGRFDFVNCSIDANNLKLIDASSGYAYGTTLRMRQCGITNMSDLFGLSTVNFLQSPFFVLYNNIFDDYETLINANTFLMPIYNWLQMAGNTFSNKSGASDLVTVAGKTYAALSDLVTAGYDDTNNPSRNENVTFTSKVFGNAAFMEPDGNQTDSKHCGVNDAIDAYTRLKWSDIVPGAWQLASVTEPDADNVLKSAGGNWDDDNILDQDDATANFRTALAVGVGLTGGLTPSGGQSSPPTALSIADNGDGQTWLVTATGQGANAAIYLYNHSGDALVAIVDASGQTKDLTAGISVYAKALENNKTLSDRYPAASGVAVPSLAAGAAPTAPALSVVDSEDAATATAAVSGADAGTTNRIYTCPVGQNTWTLKATVTGDGDATLSGLTMLEYYVKVASTNNVGSSCGQVVVFWITNGRSARTRIRDRVAGAATKIASRLGVSLTFTAVGEDAVTLQALVLRSEYMTGMIGQTDKTFIDFQVPRQSAFPPSSISVGDTVTYNSTEYMIDKYTPDNEDIQQASTFELKCWRFGQMCEIDG